MVFRSFFLTAIILACITGNSHSSTSLPAQPTPPQMSPSFLSTIEKEFYQKHPWLFAEERLRVRIPKGQASTIKNFFKAFGIGSALGVGTALLTGLFTEDPVVRGIFGTICMVSGFSGVFVSLATETVLDVLVEFLSIYDPFTSDEKNPRQYLPEELIPTFDLMHKIFKEKGITGLQEEGGVKAMEAIFRLIRSKTGTIIISS